MKNYEKPEIEVIVFVTEDVMSASGNEGPIVPFSSVWDEE